MFAAAAARLRNSWVLRFVKVALYEFCGSLRRSSRRDHFHSTIQTADVDFSGGSDAHSATRAEIFAAAAPLRNCGPDGRSVVGPCPADLEAAVFVAANQDVGQVVFQHEIKKGVAGCGIVYFESDFLFTFYIYYIIIFYKNQNKML